MIVSYFDGGAVAEEAARLHSDMVEFGLQKKRVIGSR